MTNTATVRTAEAVFDVPAEPVTADVAITPDFGTDDAGKTWLTGLFHLTHIPTGMRITKSGGCIGCARTVGKKLATIGIDWSAYGESRETNSALVGALSPDARTELANLRDLEELCNARFCREVYR